MRFSLKGSYIDFDGFRFNMIRKYGLFMIDLAAPLRAFDVSVIRNEDTEFEYNEFVPLSFAGQAVTLGKWHERLGHVSVGRIRHLHKTGQAEGLHLHNKQPHNAKCKCETCMMTSNVHRVIHDARTYTDNVSAKGELVTSDVIGPFPPTPEGHRYAVSYIDEFSRHSVVYFLKKKSEVPDTIHAVVRYYKLMGIIIKKIRSDRGGQYGGHLEREH